MAKKKNRGAELSNEAIQNYLANTVGTQIENVLHEQNFMGQALVSIDGKNILTVAFPLGESVLGQGLIGTKFYSYTVELTGKGGGKYTEKVLSPQTTNPLNYVIGLGNIYTTLSNLFGKSKMVIDFGVAVPADSEYGMIRYIVVVPPKGFEKGIHIEEPYEKMSTGGLDVYGNQGFAMNPNDMVQTSMPDGQGMYYDNHQRAHFNEYGPTDLPPTDLGQTMPSTDYSQQAPTGDLSQSLQMDLNIGPMGYTNQAQQAQPTPSPYENVQPVANHGFDPYAQINSGKQG